MNFPKLLIFNFFTKAFLSHMVSMPFLDRRQKTIAADLMFIMAIYFPLFIVALILSMIFNPDYDDNLRFQIKIISIGVLPYSLFIFMIINKDFFDGQSVAKRIQGYQIVDIKTGKVATEMQCLIRNITLIIWPIEAIFILINPHKRLGDIIAKTKLIEKEQKHPETILVDIHAFNRNKSYKKLIFISLIYIVIVDVIIGGLILTGYL